MISKETNPGLPFIGVEAPDYGVDSCRLGRLISFLSKKKKISIMGISEDSEKILKMMIAKEKNGCPRVNIHQLS